MTGLTRWWSWKGNATEAASRGLWSSGKREGSRAQKASHSFSGGIPCAIAGQLAQGCERGVYR